MIKLIVAIYRKPGMTLEAFNDRWLNVHGPLVKKHAQTLRMKRYVQSHYVSVPEIEAQLAERGWGKRPDAVTEVWWDSLDDYYAALATPEGIAANLELEADEKQFCDMHRMEAFISEEKVIFG